MLWETQVRGAMGWKFDFVYGRLRKIEPRQKTKQMLFSIFFSFVFKISCPGVFLPGKQDVYLGVYLLSQYLETNCFPSVFPIMIQQNMRFEKVILTFSLLSREI